MKKYILILFATACASACLAARHRKVAIEVTPVDTMQLLTDSLRQCRQRCDSMVALSAQSNITTRNIDRELKRLTDSVRLDSDIDTRELQIWLQTLKPLAHLSEQYDKTMKLVKAEPIISAAARTTELPYNRQTIDQCQQQLKALDLQLTEQQTKQLKTLMEQLVFYRLATKNFVSTITDIEQAAADTANFRQKVKENVIDFEARNASITRIPYMRHIFERMLTALNYSDNDFCINSVDWQTLRELREAIEADRSR